MSDKKTDAMESAALDNMGSDGVLLDTTITASYIHKFRTPIQYEGQEFKELHFDFETLTGGDSREVMRELAAKGIFVAAKTASEDYLQAMCMRACVDTMPDGRTPGTDIFNYMRVGDSNRIQNVLRRFL